VQIEKPNGFALIDLIFVCGMIGLISSIALPRMLLARQSAAAASAVGTLRTINSAQLSFAVTCGSGFYAPKLTALGITPPGSTEAFISPDISTGDTVTKSGYLFQMTADPFDGSPASCNGLAVGVTGRGYRAGADPLEPTNPRFFATNANSTIWEDVTSVYAGIGEYSEPPSAHPLR
jgi:type II secretory pathway pseudopilin PulG